MILDQKAFLRGQTSMPFILIPDMIELHLHALKAKIRKRLLEAKLACFLYKDLTKQSWAYMPTSLDQKAFVRGQTSMLFIQRPDRTELRLHAL